MELELNLRFVVSFRPMYQHGAQYKLIAVIWNIKFDV
jgi:hypothetical protein